MENSNGRWVLPPDKKATLEHELSILFQQYNLEDRSKGMVRLFGIKINQWFSEIEKHKIDKPEEPPKEFPPVNAVAYLFNLVYDVYLLPLLHLPTLHVREHTSKLKKWKRQLK